MEFLTLQPLWWLLAIVPLLAASYWFTLVDRPRKLLVAAFLCRCAAVLLLVLCLCRPYWKKESDDLHTVFLIDVSESVDSKGMKSALEQVIQARESMDAGDSSSLYIYAREVKEVELSELESLIDDVEAGRSDAEFRSASDLSQALLGSRLAFPAEKSRKLVVFSDGAPTTEVSEAVEILKDEGTNLEFSKVVSLDKPEASVVSIEPASQVAFQGEIVRLKVELYSNRKTKARLRILHRGISVAEKPVELPAGESFKTHADVEMVTSGNSVWTAELIPESDYFPLNNQVSTTITVRGKPRVLVIHKDSRKMRGISRALKEQGIQMDLRGERGLPEKLEEMLAFDAIILADVPATDLQPDQMKWLKRYVTDFGGGLAMMGSENSFGLGGYFKTPVEEVMPLVSRFEKEKQKPSLAMVLVIDKSGSMGGTPIVLARQAARAAAELLSGRDYIGVIGFDGNPQLILDLTSAGNRNQVADAIDSLQASGGTNLYPAMVQARDMLMTAPARIKHVIILTDGQTGQADHLGVTQEMVDAGMTVSAVALGQGSARQLLQSIAETGKGRYYETNDPANVPQIFTRETMQASKSAIKEDVFATVQLADHPVLAGYQKAELPYVLGYVMTRPKPTAEVLLVTETGDPLLAVGRFGLGSGLAWTSDLTERWGSEWLSWSGGGKFWAQVIRGILRKDNSAGLAVTGAVNGERWLLDMRRSDEAGRPVSGVKWSSEALDENGKTVPVSVKEVGLGRYAVEVSTVGSERLALRLHDPDGGAMKTVQWTRPYPAEYRLNAKMSNSLASLTKYDLERSRSVTDPVSIRSSAMPFFGLLAIGMLLGGLVLRRI